MKDGRRRSGWWRRVVGSLFSFFSPSFLLLHLSISPSLLFSPSVWVYNIMEWRVVSQTSQYGIVQLMSPESSFAILASSLTNGWSLLSSPSLLPSNTPLCATDVLSAQTIIDRSRDLILLVHPAADALFSWSFSTVSSLPLFSLHSPLPLHSLSSLHTPPAS